MCKRESVCVCVRERVCVREKKGVCKRERESESPDTLCRPAISPGHTCLVGCAREGEGEIETECERERDRYSV